MHTEDTISAISTPLGRGGIGIVRLSGTLSLQIVKRTFVSHNGNENTLSVSHKVYSGKIIDPFTKKVIDEVLVTVMKAPNSYTKEDVVEISCHGGMAVLSKVLDLTLKEGARLALPGEFTKRAFLNGRIDLTQAEAVIDIINAKTESSLFNTASQLNGSVSNEIESIRSLLVDVSSKLELSIDFSEEDVPTRSLDEIKKSLIDAKERIESLVDSYGSGRLLREGIKVVIAGRTNAGKSSLFNLLLRKDRSIVTHYPGTTRDFIEEDLLLDGVTYKIFDTAGIRKVAGPRPNCPTKTLLKKHNFTDLQYRSNHEIESKGIARSYELIENADITLLIIPASEDLTEEDIFLISAINNKNKECLYVLNKIDLQQQVDSKRMSEISGIAPEKILKISVKKNIGINQLKNRIKQLITDNQAGLDTEKTIICNIRHKNLLDRALESINTAKDACEKKASEEFITFDVSKALNCLDEITGQSYSDEVLDKIFNEFCIGK
ncbi:MAG: tRNA uridine-5-carboxymethylaminomethyl(34) synthesis GTPase MnmE [Nitrospinota bacterium]